MKIKNIKYYSTTLLLAAAIGFTGCNSNKLTKEEQIIDTLADKSNGDSFSKTNLSVNEINNIITSINSHFNQLITINYYENLGVVGIYGPWDNELLPELTNDLYDEFNLLLEQTSVQSIEIHRIGNEFDFNKVNLSNIKNITFDRCKYQFNYEPFKNHIFEYISFESIPSEYAKTIVENSCTQDTDVMYIDYASNKEVSNFINFLVDDNIPLNKLYITTDECSQKDYTTISKINAKCIDITSFSPSDETYNLELYPNQNTETIRIWCNGSNVELGNINVVTDHPFFRFSINGPNCSITQNTNFNLSDNLTFSLSANCESENKLYDLSNVQAFVFYDYDSEYVISYDSVNNNFEAAINDYTKDKEFIKELRMK